MHPYSRGYTPPPWHSAIDFTENWPKPGVRFADIAPVLADPTRLNQLVLAMSAFVGQHHVSHILGLEARGFILAAAVAHYTGRGLFLARKAGKTPPPVNSVSYDLEYGQATLEIGKYRIASADRVLVVDDVLATGGTAKAAIELVQQAGATPVAVACAIEVPALNGRAVLEATGTTVHTLHLI